MWNDLFFLNESDDDEEKKKNDEKKDEEKEDKKKEEEESEKKKDKDTDDDSDDFNDLNLMGDDDDIESDVDDTDSEMNDLGLGDDSSVADDSSDNDSEFNALLIVGDDDNSNEYSGNGEDPVYEKALKCAYATTIFMMNLKYIGINAVGERLEEIRRKCTDLYYSIECFSSTLYSYASESMTIDIDNPIRAKEHCESMTIADEKQYDYFDALKMIDTNISELLQYLKCLSGMSDRKDITDSCNSIIGNLEKESRCTIKRVLCGKSSSCFGDENKVATTEGYNFNRLF